MDFVFADLGENLGIGAFHGSERMPLYAIDGSHIHAYHYVL
jgi:hypothetical protein